MKIISLITIAGLCLSTSCDEDILTIQNQNQYTEDSYFASGPQFNEAVVATYSCLLHKGLYSRDYYFLFDLLANDAKNNTFLLGDLAQLQDYSYGPSSPPLTDLWRSLYQMVLRSNLILRKSETWEPTLQEDLALKAQYIAEAKFLRGFAYFQLVTLWGRVPLTLEDEADASADKGRSELADIWSVVETDLTAAADGLPVAFDESQRGRATKGAALALLGKAYLFQKKYSEAEAQLAKLTAAPFTYALNASFAAQFSPTNSGTVETVFDIPHKWNGWGVGNQYYMFGGQEAWGGQATHSGRAQEYGFNDWNNVLMSEASLAAFKYKDEGGADYTDPRAFDTFYGDAASGGDTDFCNNCTGGAKPYPFATEGYTWKKYEYYEDVETYGGPASEINSQVIRYADVLLMLAEARIEQNNVSGALPLINQVRTRSTAFTFTTLGSQDNARALLRRERQIELCGEQTRWFDLVRWGVAKQVLNTEKQAQLGKQPFEDKHVLLPIPQLEKDSNPPVAADVDGGWN